LYFHAQYRQATPNRAVSFPSSDKELNPDGKQNYVYMETRGSGHLMGVTLGVLQIAERWMGEGDDMVFVDDESKPVITGTGSEDYFCGAWDFGGRDGAIPFAHLYNGAHLISAAEKSGGRYCLYRWHADNPITFKKYLKHTMEHGHANDRADYFYSVAYWYQSEPYTEFPALPSVADRIPVIKLS
jgi:D-arabinan exo alpha-(1,3)/(1,5)-arabinofuranosidase (non-reducing end)